MNTSGDSISRAINTSGLVGVAQYVWDSTNLIWVVYSGASGGTGGAGDASAANQTTEIARLTSIRDSLAGTIAVSGPLTDTQLRATAVPVSGPLTDTQLRATAVPVSGPLTDTQLRATAVPISVDGAKTTAATLPAGGSGAIGWLSAIANYLANVLTVSVNNFPASQAVTGPLTDTQLRATAVPVSGPLTDTQLRASAVPVSGPLTDTQLRASAVPVSGPLTDTQLRATAVPVSAPTITKGTQGANGFTTQDLKDAGRNQTNYFMALPIVTTTADVLMSLTGYKAGAAVAATTTPAVVTAAKTYRITAITITYVAIATAGSVKVSLRANTGGVVAVTSPVVCSWVVGGPAAAAGVAQTVDVAIPDGLEFAAGTGIGITISGLSATQTAAAVGYGQVAMNGFEY